MSSGGFGLRWVRRTGVRLVFVGVLAPLVTSCTAPTPPADLVLRGGKIVTLDEARSVASALASRDGRIVALGTAAEVERYVGPETEVLDLEGRLAIPGFIEGHGHLLSLGRSLRNVRLGGAETWEEVVALVARAARDAAPGEWIVGRGWHQEKWAHPPVPAIEGYPVHARLSEATPDHPVLLAHASGHALLVNARALELAGIDAGTPDPEGGRILRDRNGEPTGVLRETAGSLVSRAYEAATAVRTPERQRAERRGAIELAVRECLAKGVTSFQDAGSSFETVDLLAEMASAGELPIRLWVMLSEDNDALERRLDDYRRIGAADEHLTVRAIKRSIDGALGSHGAWLLEPYADLPDSAGLNTTPLDELERTARIALEHDVQLCVHAIGDRANRETLDLYERAFAAHPGGSDLRWRVEHAQHLHPSDVPRFAELGVIASVQGIHCTSDGPWVPSRIGHERAESGAYVWRSLLDSGAVVSNGTDVPVEDVDPLANFHATVTRRMANGQPFYPGQRLTREEALESYTLAAAYAAFEDSIKGSLEVGKLADVTVLSRDILTIPDEEIPGTEVHYTIVGGSIRYKKPETKVKTEPRRGPALSATSARPQPG